MQQTTQTTALAEMMLVTKEEVQMVLDDRFMRKMKQEVADFVTANRSPSEEEVVKFFTPYLDEVLRINNRAVDAKQAVGEAVYEVLLKICVLEHDAECLPLAMEELRETMKDLKYIDPVSR